MSDLAFTVALCTLNRRALLMRAMDEVFRQLAEFPNGRFIVVDNGSTDGTRDYLAETAKVQPQLTVITHDRRGLYYARCAALREAGGEFVLFLDDDTVPGEGWMRGMLSELASDTTVGCVGSAVEPIFSQPRPDWLNDRLLREIPIFRVAGGRQAAEFPCYPPGLSLGIRRVSCLEVYFDEARMNAPLGIQGTDAKRSIRLGGEDTDLCEIYARNGYRVIAVDHIHVGHEVPTERLDAAWFNRSFRAAGHLRIRLARLTGRGLLHPYAARVLLALPLVVAAQLLLPVLSAGNRLLLRCYLVKSLSAWTELLFGPRTAWPYTLSEMLGARSAE